jgi:hypothetical protein
VRNPRAESGKMEMPMRGTEADQLEMGGKSYKKNREIADHQVFLLSNQQREKPNREASFKYLEAYKK